MVFFKIFLLKNSLWNKKYNWHKELASVILVSLLQLSILYDSAMFRNEKNKLLNEFDRTV